MINASVNGWVDKFFIEQNIQPYPIITNQQLFYEETRKTGFFIGYTTQIATQNKLETIGWTTEEFSKIGLLNTLFGTYQLIMKNQNHDFFINKCLAFYNTLHHKNSGLLDKILPQDTLSNKLEKIINSRVQTNHNIISKNFSHILTNALLFIDVLAFKKYLLLGKIPEKYLQKTEEIIINIIILSLETKNTKSKYDNLILKLFESSVRYTKFNPSEAISLENMNLSYFQDDYEKYYVIDLAIIAMWSDQKIENKELIFLQKLSNQLKIPINFSQKSIHDIHNFIKENKEQIPYFKFSNPVKHFYDHTIKSVHILLSRNKNRLLLEISQSKELMILLAKSTQTELSEQEKKKVKNQLLDICKTIPSLTIFLVPGGSLLLPILIKFIPQLLPSAFNENLNKE